MSRIVQIFMPLLQEGVDVWRPVQAEHLRDNVYRILGKPPESQDESWTFSPGEEVVCEIIDSSEGRILAATKRADWH
jgi:hypothetical protein